MPPSAAELPLATDSSFARVHLRPSNELVVGVGLKAEEVHFGVWGAGVRSLEGEVEGR